VFSPLNSKAEGKESYSIKEQVNPTASSVFKLNDT